MAERGNRRYRARPSRRTSSQIRQYAHLARERPGNATEPDVGQVLRLSDLTGH